MSKTCVAKKAASTVKLAVIGASACIIGVAFAACVEPPPKIAAIPASGMSLRVYVFGASAQDARQAFVSAKQTNKNLSIVNEGGDGEVLLGIENDSPKCVPPTALCSFKVSFRVRDNQGKIVHASTTSATANAERCADLCEKALNQIVVKVIEAAAGSLKGSSGGGADTSDAAAATTADGADPNEAGVGVASETSSSDAGSTAGADAGSATKPPVKKAGGKPKAEPPPPPPPPPPAKAEPAICSVAHGPHLPSEEAEKRAAQVEVLKRLSILDQEEYDCLRKAYLDRL